jgi:acyl-CoA thioesterase FadM
MKRQFSQTHIVRYDECNSDGLLTPTAFVRYMQDIAARDAEDAQLVGDGYWVVKRSTISFKAPIKLHTRLELKTYGISFTRIKAQRGYEARIADDPSDEPIITARSLWVYIDPRGRPIRLPEETAQIWLPDGPLPQQPEAPIPAFPESAPETTTSAVRFSDIDPMKHMNNASVVEMLDNAGWEAYAQGGITPETAQLQAVQYDIEYVDSPRFGDRLEIQSWLLPFPSPGQQFSRLQQITREDSVMVRAHSRWLWRAER